MISVRKANKKKVITEFNWHIQVLCDRFHGIILRSTENVYCADKYLKNKIETEA